MNFDSLTCCLNMEASEMSITGNGETPTVENDSWREDLARERAKNLRDKTLGEMIYLFPWGLLIAFVVAAGMSFYYELWVWVAVDVIIAGGFFWAGIKTIPAVAPASFALLTFWGMRFPVVAREGKKLLAPYPPFYINLIPISVEQQNLDFVFRHIRCRLEEKDEGKGVVNPRSGGAVMIEVSLTMVPDDSRFDEYIIAGGATPSKTATTETSTVNHDIVHDMLGEALRQEGGRRTWERMTFSQEWLTVMLITLLTGHSSGVENPLETEDQDERNKRTKALKEFQKRFLEGAFGNGVADIHGLGGRIRRINVVRVEPDGDLAKAAERAAIEQQERQAEMTETDAVIAMAKQYQNGSEDANGNPTLSYEEALKAARIERRKASEIIVRSNNPLIDAAALVGGQRPRGQ